LIFCLGCGKRMEVNANMKVSNPLIATLFFVHWLLFNLWFINILPYPLNIAIILWCLCVGGFVAYIIFFYKDEISRERT
jgi:hypothetical protein